MADDITLSIGAEDGSTIQTDQIGAGAHYQRIKITDGVADSEVHLGVVADDAAVVAADTGILAMAVATPTDTSVDANDTGFIGMSTDRRLHTDSDLQINGTAITAAAGAVAASTPRVTLGSDDPAVVLLGTIDSDTNTIQGDTTTIAGAVYAEDAASGAGDPGTPVMAVRKATPADTSTADGDYEFLQMDEGYLHTRGKDDAAALALLTTIDADTNVIQGAVASGQMQVDIVADGAGLLTPSAHDAAFGTAGTADAQVRTIQGVASMTPILADVTGQGDVPITLAGEPVVLGAGTAEVGKLAAGTAEIGNVKNSGTFVTQNTAQASTNTQEIVGDVAHDAAAAGNPVAVAARAAATVEGLTQVAGADASFVTADLNGCLVTRNGTTLEELVSERISNTNGTSTDCTGAFAAGGANIHAYITSVTIHNANASTNGYVDLRDGAAGSIKWTFPAPATGGATHNFDPPLKFAANTAVAYDVSAAITTVYISFNGYFAQG